MERDGTGRGIIRPLPPARRFADPGRPRRELADSAGTAPAVAPVPRPAVTSETGASEQRGTMHQLAGTTRPFR